ncbi:hypothetical protein SAMN04488020_102530 [Palleronia marisminoris]|uniref:YD repeat-containing protein n=1 Tax=Palleronia marisminoris TaxID=315423 RepID=A0A1Y5RPZ6_9RHOB|nr:hypothetical protein [Palleronia marisminoris]SFG55655.1 hypothetical protein SAMN04488020_102530 [Palleronia marisminoris]SLN22722.1 hypothetical protein PAM7066_00751 [Palleronia marisminoris]
MKASALSGALALCLLAGTASAQDYQAIAQELYDQGFENQATIRVRDDGLYVETSGSAGTTERVYSLDGTVLREEETRTSDGRKIEREFDESGSLVDEEIKTAEDRKGAVVERVYSETGSLLSEEISTPGGTRIERTYDADGNVVSNNVSRDREARSRGRSEERADRGKSDRGSDKSSGRGNSERGSEKSSDRGNDNRGDGDRKGGGNGRGRG